MTVSSQGEDRADDDARRPLPEATVVRLHRYRRLLGDVVDEGVSTVSSEDLATAAGVNPAQVRKDLSWVGSFGTRGVGYPAVELRAHLTQVLGLEGQWRIAIVGAGNLGRALAGYRGFSAGGFRVVALFDVASDVVGSEVAGLSVRHIDDLEEVVRSARVDLAVLAVPAEAADDVAGRLVASGVSALLNFAPAHLQVDARVRPVDLSTEIGVLAYYEHVQREPAEHAEAATDPPLDSTDDARHAAQSGDRRTTQ